MCNSIINLSNKSKQTGLNRCTHSALLLHTYTCQVQKVLCALIGWGLTSKSAWAIAVELCTEMFTYTHFLFSWVLVSYHSCWLITKPRLGKGSWPSSQCLLHLGYLIGSRDRLNGYLATCVHDSHTQVRCCLGRLQNNTECSLWERESECGKVDTN